jgi:hypothetical protein
MPRVRCRTLVLAILAAWLSASPLVAQDSLEAKRLRVLIAVDTHDQMGLAWGIDGANMREILKGTLKKQNLDSRVTIDMFTGKEVTPENILAYYQGLNAGPDDAMLFYYSGHGGFHLKRGHFMALHYGHLFRADLIVAMKKNNPRLMVLLTDCCANFSGGAKMEEPKATVLNEPIELQPLRPKAKRQEPSGKVLRSKEARPSGPPRPDININFTYTFPKAKKEAPAGKEINAVIQVRPTFPKAKKEEPAGKVIAGATTGMVLQTGTGPLPLDDIMKQTDGEVMRHLLFRHRGVVDINGCTKGAFSMGTPQWGGSLFTIAFMELQRDKLAKFDKNDNQLIEWNEFFPFLRDGTRAASRRMAPGAAMQSPEATQLGLPAKN